MALQVQRSDVWAGDVSDVPGGLADMLGPLADAGASLDFVIARRDPSQPGQGQVFVTPVKGKRAEGAAENVGLRRADTVSTLRVEGPDKAGLGNRIARSIADQGINVRGVSAAVIGARFVAYLGFDNAEDADRAAQALKGVDAAPRRRRSTAARRKPVARRR
jgi:hypothetical protein